MNNTSLIKISQLSLSQIKQLIKTAKDYKQSPEQWSHVLENRQIALLFEKPSLRTRVSLSAGLSRMGATVHYFDHQQDKLGQRETLKDLAKNLSTYLDALVARTDTHETVTGLEQHSSIPVINALCNRHHPCQALADLMTLTEVMGDISRIHMTYAGEGNNVCHSLMEIFAITGAHLSVVVPKEGMPDSEITHWCLNKTKESGGSLEIIHSFDALNKTDVIYTDTWLSMGSRENPDETAKRYRPFQINDDVMKKTGAQWFMHCQPMHRGLEVTSSVADSDSSLIYQQAANRLNVQNAFFIQSLGKGVPAT